MKVFSDRKTYQRYYYLRNREREKEKQRQRNTREIAKRYYQLHCQQRLNYQKEYNHLNQDHIRKYDRKYKRLHPKLKQGGYKKVKILKPEDPKIRDDMFILEFN
jgi:hypothetical protein